MKSQRTTEADADDRQYLVFSLGKEEYAIDILKVQEIRGYDQVTRIANVPDFIKGVSNLRGIIVPIVDLRIKFRLEDIRYDEHTVVIVVDIGERVIGIVVDRVSDVMTLTPEQSRPAPEFGVRVPLDYIHGLGNLDDRMLILMDIEKLLNSREMALVEEAAAEEDAGVAASTGN